MQYESPTSWFKSYGQGQSLLKVGQTSRSRSQGQNVWYHLKGLVTRNTYVQYESPTSSDLKVMTKVKGFVHAANGDTDADTEARATTLAPPGHSSLLA